MNEDAFEFLNLTQKLNTKTYPRKVKEKEDFCLNQFVSSELKIPR